MNTDSSTSVGGQPGNTNSSRDNRLWRNTIQRAIAQGDPERLRRIADKLLDKAAEGDMAAIKELGDRIDGKASQQIELTGDADKPVAHRIEMVVVDPKS